MAGENAPEELVLAGYVQLAEQGFAMPAFATGQAANAWYCAVPNIDSDHLSTINHFAQLVEEEPIHLLPLDLQLTVRTGDLWRDVFLWNGQPVVGTPAEIHNALLAEYEQIGREAPLSLLDLALFNNSPSVPELAQSARTLLAERLGPAGVEERFQQLVARPGVQLLIRRQLVAIGADPNEVDPVKIEARDGSTLAARIPSTVFRLFARSSVLDIVAQSVAEFGRSIGLNIGIEREPFVDEITPTPEIRRVELEESAIDLPNILIIALGSQAWRIGKLIAPPEEVTLPGGLAFHTGAYSRDWLPSGRRFGLTSAASSSAIRLTDEIPSPIELSDYGVVVCLAEDGALNDNDFARQLGEIGDWVDRRRRMSFLLAPTLPLFGPSAIADPSRRTLLDDLRFHAVIDTSLSRSPFWPGHMKLSMDRRKADIVAMVATVAALHPDWMTTLRGDRRLYDPILLSLRMDTKRRYSGMSATASEMSQAGLSDTRNSEILDRIGFEVRHDERSVVQNVSIELQRLQVRFDIFARAVVDEVSQSDAPIQGPSNLRDALPPQLLSELLYPNMAAAFSLPKAASAGLVVTAEAPAMPALRAAGKAEWSLVRYTDAESLRAVLTGPHGEVSGRIPREIALPKLNKYVRNRRLATRGVDVRDVYRISINFWAETRDRFPSDLVRGARMFLGSVEGGASEVAFPADSVRAAAARGDPLAKEVIELSNRRGPLGRERRRPADLRTAWSRPFDGGTRYVIEDGRLPVEVTQLKDEEVPAQHIFMIDGDGSVPALLTSRLFKVWAGATMQSSPSWSSRFRLGLTFETFPIPSEFIVLQSDTDAPAQLRVSPNPGRLRKFAPMFRDNSNELTQIIDARNRQEVAWEGHPLMKQIEVALLSTIGLESGATDLDILERLVERNKRG